MTASITVVLPAKNEAPALRELIPRLRRQLPEAELIVVDDGSQDETGAVAMAAGARVLRSPYSMGNGAAIKRGAHAASGEVIVFMDADGQHDPADIPRLLRACRKGMTWSSVPVTARGRPVSAAVWPTACTTRRQLHDRVRCA